MTNYPTFDYCKRFRIFTKVSVFFNILLAAVLILNIKNWKER